MKKLTNIILFVIASNSIFGQVDNIESLMTRRYLSCQDIHYNVQYLIPEYHQKGSYDTLNAIVNYWENQCGTSEELVRCKILLAIDRGDFSEENYDSNIINYLIEYKNGLNPIYYTYGRVYFNYNGYSYNQPDILKNFTVQLASDLLKRNNLKPIEIFFLRVYSNDLKNTFSMIMTEDFNTTLLQESYFKEVHRYKKPMLGHYDFLLGAWIPQNNLQILGSHPFLGIRGGIKYKNLIVDATLGFKFGKSLNVYQVQENDSIWDTDHFFGGYIGLDAAIEIFTIQRSSIDLIGGIAYDGFDALKVKDKNSNDDISKSINSLNLNIGLGYKYYFNKLNYIGLDVKYNFLNYKNHRGTDLGGNAFSIHLIYGFRGNRYNINRLENLDYIY